jgi:hypothetical protein
MLEEKNPDFYYEVTENPKNWREKTIKVTRATKEEGEAFRAAQDKKKKEDLDRTLGFSRVWRELINFKKPVIGHNLFLDLLFTFEHFHGNNPVTFGRFKEVVHECWPHLYDTKVLSSEFGREDINSRLNLEDLHSKLQEITQITAKIGEGFIDYTSGNSDTFHDAGYDAFVTGCCYYMLSKLPDSESIFKEFENRVRLGTSRMFLADFADPEKDVVTADKMFVIILTEKSKDGERSESQKTQIEVLSALKDEHKVGMVSSIHNNPASMYQRTNFVSYFFGFDKKL